MKQATKTQSAVLEGLNVQQKKAITFGNGPLLIIAGAGTGKTTVITRRIAWLLEEGLAKPEEILALTFTEKAAGEMEERVDQLLPLGYAELDISTFHAFAHKILTQHALDIGLPGDFRVLTDTQAWMLVKKHLNEFDLDYYRPVGNPNKFIHSLLKHFNKAKGEEITPQDYLDYASKLRLALDKVELKGKSKKSKVKNETSEIDEQEIARISEVAGAYHKYQKLLLDQGFLDFGDLINYTLKLFRTRPKILKFYQNRYKYILVDEFQDTDLSQYELVKLLALPHNNIAVVGDDDQSIYKFRGASVSNILKFKDDFKDAAEITLTDNYRSTQNILDLAYGFIQQNNPERLESRLKIDKKLKSHRSEPDEIKVLHGRTIYDEVKSVTDKIVELSGQGGGWNDFAILVRANDHADPFILELAKRGIPYMFVANRGLYKRPFVLDLMAYFKLLDDHHESENLFRIFNMEKFKIDEEDLILVSQAAKRRSFSVYEVLKDARSIVKLSEPTHKKIQALLDLLNKHTVLARETPASELLVRIVEDLGLDKELVQDSAANAEKRDLLQQFYKKIQSFEQESDDKTMKAFLNQIRLELEAGDQGELAFNPDFGPDAVKVMTVHSAKGLEFSTVFIVNLVDQRFPSRERREQIEIPTELVKEILPEGDVHLMEERRLFYVAMTRAKQRLYLTWADDYGGATHKKPSRFLIELKLESEPEKPKPLGEVFFAKTKPVPSLPVKYMVPETFSFSQISCFLNCPLEYKLKYIYQLPLPGTANLSLGDTIHKTLQKYLEHYRQINSYQQSDLFGDKNKGVQIPSTDVLRKFYAESWVDDWYPDKFDKERARKLGLKMLDNFYDRFKDSPKPVKFLEQRFKLKLGDYKFVGKIDRADENSDGTIDIIDYKTGQIKEKLNADDKNQLIIYQWAAEEEFNQRVRSLRYWYLKSLGESQEFLATPDEVGKLKEKLLEIITDIVAAVRSNSFAALDRKKAHDCKYRYLES